MNTALQTSAAPPPNPPRAAGADALARLFRISIRAGRVHPLQHLVQRYRNGERA